jgi:branched-chain amino acid transport system substrate-binding protein
MTEGGSQVRRRSIVAVAGFAVLSLIAAACAKESTTTSATGCVAKPKLSALGSVNTRSVSGVHMAGAITANRVLGKESKPVVTIGFIGDLTGSNAALVVPGRNGAQLAIDQANAKGDLPVKIAFAPKDNKEALPQTAPGIAQNLINDRTVVAVIGPAFSGETSAVQPLFKAAGLVHITQSATRLDLTSGGFTTFFRGLASNADEANAAAKILKKLGCKKAAVIDDKSAYGQDLASTAATKFPFAGARIVDRESIAPATDYTSLVDTLITKKPDVVLYGGYEPQASILLKQMREKGVKSFFIVGDGAKNVKFGPDAGSLNAEGAIAVAPARDPNVATDADSQKFVKDYEAAFKTLPDIYAPEGFDIANIYIAAIADCSKSGASGVTRACVLNFVTNLKDFKGLTKTFGWTTDPKALHEVTDKFMNVYQIVGKNGQYVLLGEITTVAP